MTRRTILGPGDDCAILSPTSGRNFSLSTRCSRTYTFASRGGTPEKLGAKSLSVNLSDIAAMGGKPTACVINLAVREGLEARFFDRLYAGILTSPSAMIPMWWAEIHARRSPRNHRRSSGRGLQECDAA